MNVDHDKIERVSLPDELDQALVLWMRDGTIIRVQWPDGHDCELSDIEVSTDMGWKLLKEME